jgi:hypothetical protein
MHPDVVEALTRLAEQAREDPGDDLTIIRAKAGGLQTTYEDENPICYVPILIWMVFLPLFVHGYG